MCLSARLAQKLQIIYFISSVKTPVVDRPQLIHVQTSRNFLYVNVARVQFFPDDNAIRYGLHYVGMTSCFHMMRSVRQNPKTTLLFRQVSQVMAPEVKSDVYDCLVLPFCCRRYSRPSKIHKNGNAVATGAPSK